LDNRNFSVILLKNFTDFRNILDNFFNLLVSSSETKVIAFPAFPALPVLPIL